MKLVKALTKKDAFFSFLEVRENLPSTASCLMPKSDTNKKFDEVLEYSRLRVVDFCFLYQQVLEEIFNVKN